MVSRSQRYADIVFEKIKTFVGAPSSDLSGYKSLCKRSGGLLRTLGLMQFLVFLKAKEAKNTQHGVLLKHLQEELKELKDLETSNENDLIQKVLKETLPSYMKITKTVLLLLQWHKRIAEILIDAEALEENV
ncbi:MAG: type III-B CRISPR module-associated protein Cmr5 [Spirochaetales bacterium]|nr:type III-B CRISPR module-associated protein Cmr5 [Spirochaetales bacterium]